MSNPKPVEGALTVEQVHKAVQETQQPWSSVSPSYYAVTNVPALTAKLNEMLEAALSAAAPARDGVRLTAQQKEDLLFMARAISDKGLPIGVAEMEQRLLEYVEALMAAKEQADGQ